MKNFIIRSLAKTLTFQQSLSLVSDILSMQGIGIRETDIHATGELASFSFVRRENPILFDVGGFKGDYTKAFLDQFPSGYSVIYEPSKPSFGSLRDAFFQNPRVALVHAALGADDHRATLYKDSESSCLASMTKRQLDHYHIDFSLTEEIEVKTLDDEAARQKIDFIDLLKIDVEGHELDVLRGAQGLLGANKIGAIQFEFGGTHLDTRTSFRDFFYFLSERGYTVNLIRPDRTIVPITIYTETLEQYALTNFIGLPPS